jgi:hypothetical protein
LTIVLPGRSPRAGRPDFLPRESNGSTRDEAAGDVWMPLDDTLAAYEPLAAQLKTS